jgi:hypothetical protein
MSKESIERALSALEAEKANLLPEQRQRLAELSKEGKDVRSDVAEVLEAKEKRELTSKQADRLVNTLKFRFKLPGNNELREAIDFADVKKSLRAAPEKLYALYKLEETGGEPQVIGIDGDEFIFEDRSAESPLGRRNKNFDEADGQRKEFGPSVKFQSPDSYKDMQKTGKYDLNSGSWLETDPEYRERTGLALVGNRDEGGVLVGKRGAERNAPDGGWRASIRVKKA